MTTPARIRLDYDGGWREDGCPGAGRLRFNHPRIGKANFINISAECADKSLLGELVPRWGVGDVIVIERAGDTHADNRVVAWIVGPIWHAGSYYKLPVAIRSVHGGFADYDGLILTHHGNLQDIGADRSLPRDVTPMPMLAAPMPVDILPNDAPTAPLLAPIAPLAPENTGPPPIPQFRPEPPPIAPIAPMAGPSSEVVHSLQVENQTYRSENNQLREIIAKLVSDPTELYVVEGAH